MLFNLTPAPINQDLSKPLIAVIQKAEAPKPVEYVVKDNDSLAKIAVVQNTNIERLWEKNTQIENPDVIKPGDKLIIPKPDEALPDRPLPEIPVLVNPALLVAPVTSKGQLPSNTKAQAQVQAQVRRGAVAGNTYSNGYCTWYAKNQRPDMPNNLGNADTWYVRAAAQGFAVGYAPQVGAVAAAVGYMHVAIVTAVNGDGTIQVSEMNYKGWGVVSSRTAQASEFRYIY